MRVGLIPKFYIPWASWTCWTWTLHWQSLTNASQCRCITFPSRLKVWGGCIFPGKQSSFTASGAFPASSTSVSRRMYWWLRYLSRHENFGGCRNALSSILSTTSIAQCPWSKFSEATTNWNWLRTISSNWHKSYPQCRFWSTCQSNIDSV